MTTAAAVLLPGGDVVIPAELLAALPVQFGKYALNRGFYWLQLRACRETSSRWSP